MKKTFTTLLLLMQLTALAQPDVLFASSDRAGHDGLFSIKECSTVIAVTCGQLAGTMADVLRSAGLVTRLSSPSQDDRQHSRKDNESFALAATVPSLARSGSSTRSIQRFEYMKFVALPASALPSAPNPLACFLFFLCCALVLSRFRVSSRMPRDSITAVSLCPSLFACRPDLTNVGLGFFDFLHLQKNSFGFLDRMHNFRYNAFCITTSQGEILEPKRQTCMAQVRKVGCSSKRTALLPKFLNNLDFVFFFAFDVPQKYMKREVTVLQVSSQIA